MGNCLGRNLQSQNNRAYDRLADPEKPPFKGPPPKYKYMQGGKGDNAHAVEVCLL